MKFDVEYARFISHHRDQSSGFRLSRLVDGHGHAEKLFLREVWWEAFHNFDDLHPEYEIRDYKDGIRYLDFAYIKPNYRLAIEIDGFGPHAKEITNQQFTDERRRRNDLSIGGWYTLYFSFTDVRSHPRECQSTVQQLLGRWLGPAALLNSTSVFEREIIRLAIQTVTPITPDRVCKHLGVSPDLTYDLLHKLIKNGWLEPASGKARIRSYKLNPTREGIRLY